MNLASLGLFIVPMLALNSEASVLMLDFGPTTVSEENRSNSPYHTVNASAGLSWNKVSTLEDEDHIAVQDLMSGLVFADGTSATGIGVNVGVATGTEVNLGVQPVRNSPLGGNFYTGIYSEGSVGRDGIFTTSAVALGIQVTGLAPGIYEVFLATRNTSFNGSNTQISYAGSGVAGANYDYSSYLSASLAFPSGAPAPTTWIEGESYVKLTVALAAGDALNLAVIGKADRGFLNAVQIVSVPEPSYGIMACGLLVTFTFRRRAKRG
jgi:hypothetical protein